MWILLLQFSLVRMMNKNKEPCNSRCTNCHQHIYLLPFCISCCNSALPQCVCASSPLVLCMSVVGFCIAWPIHLKHFQTGGPEVTGSEPGWCEGQELASKDGHIFYYLEEDK